MADIVATSIAETEKLAAEFALEILASSERRRAAVVLLSGDLGAGKTAFVKGVAEALGVGKEAVTSPTFVLEKIYDLSGKAAGRFTKLVHIDAYRLERPEEAAPLKLAELFADPGALVFIEWPERIKEHLPEGARTFFFTHEGGDRRRISSGNA